MTGIVINPLCYSVPLKVFDALTFGFLFVLLAIVLVATYLKFGLFDVFDVETKEL